jgi:DNA-binding MarR family transcriptional regulator
MQYRGSVADRVDELIGAWRATMPDALGPMSELTKRIMVLAADLDAATRRELPALGLTAAEFDVLAALRRSGRPFRLTPNALSRSLLLSTGGTSNVVNRLSARGLVRREHHPDDGRSTLIQLTADGKRLAENAIRVNTAAHEEVFADVSPAVARAATDALRKVFTAMDRRHPRSR